MTLYALVATAVYDHGIIGVYSTEDLACEAAEEIWLKTDGHHAFRIDELVLDETRENMFQYHWSLAPNPDPSSFAKSPAQIIKDTSAESSTL